MKSQPKVTNTSEVQWTDLKMISLHPACPSASLSHYDYVMHNLGSHHCSESGAYIFQSRELILVHRSVPCPRHVR